jgi:hypothetical protein
MQPVPRRRRGNSARRQSEARPMLGNSVALTLPLIVPLTLPLIVALTLFLRSVDSPLIHSVDSLRCQFRRSEGCPVYSPPVSINGNAPEPGISEISTLWKLSTGLSTALSTDCQRGTYTPSLVDRKDQCMRGAFHRFTQTVVGSSLYGH